MCRDYHNYTQPLFIFCMAILGIIDLDDKTLNNGDHKPSLHYIFIHILLVHYQGIIPTLSRLQDIYGHKAFIYYRYFCISQFLNILLKVFMIYIYIIFQFILNMIDTILDDRETYTYDHILTFYHMFAYKLEELFHIFMVDF